MSNPANHFHAVCYDCGTVKDASHDGAVCRCGGIFHVESAFCSHCGKRYGFTEIGKKCDCNQAAEIVPKICRCPGCKTVFPISTLGTSCPGCKMLLVMEG